MSHSMIVSVSNCPTSTGSAKGIAALYALPNIFSFMHTSRGLPLMLSMHAFAKAFRDQCLANPACYRLTLSKWYNL